jgi:hypothetical protein
LELPPPTIVPISLIIAIFFWPLSPNALESTACRNLYCWQQAQCKDVLRLSTSVIHEHLFNVRPLTQLMTNTCDNGCACKDSKLSYT